MDSGLLYLVVTVVAIVAVVFARRDRYKLTSTEQAMSTFQDAMQLVRTYAPAADQLVKLGELDKEDRRDYVISMVCDVLKGIDIGQVEAIVEAWVAKNKPEPTE